MLKAVPSVPAGWTSFAPSLRKPPSGRSHFDIHCCARSIDGHGVDALPAPQDIADNSVQHLALTKYVAILAFAPVNRAWAAARDLCAGSEAMARPAGSGSAAGGHPPRTRRATVLLMTLAVLDVSSYLMHCLGALMCCMPCIVQAWRWAAFYATHLARCSTTAHPSAFATVMTVTPCCHTRRICAVRVSPGNRGLRSRRAAVDGFNDALCSGTTASSWAAAGGGFFGCSSFDPCDNCRA